MCENNRRWSLGNTIQIAIFVVGLALHYFATVAATGETLGRHDERIKANKEQITKHVTDIATLQKEKADK